MESYFIVVADGEHRDFQSGSLGVIVKKVPSLGGQLQCEGLVVDAHLPETLSSRWSDHAEGDSSVRALSRDLWRDFKRRGLHFKTRPH